jgi:hypothetical protein
MSVVRLLFVSIACVLVSKAITTAGNSTGEPRLCVGKQVPVP